MSFRQYGGINYAAKNNIVKNNYSNANNLSVMTKVGQPSSYINFESDISGNTIYGSYDFQGDVSITGTLTVSKDALINGVTVGKGGGSISSNTAVGSYSLQSNTTGINNTALGYASLINNTTSSQNTAIGYTALYTQKISGTSNGAGGWQNTLGDNTAIGVGALYWNNGSGLDPSGNLSGAWNTAVGLNALRFNTTGYYNTAIGLQAGCYFNNAQPNGGGPSTANKCTFLGAESRSSTTNPTQSTAIGYNSVITANNQIMMGTSTETVYIPGKLTVVSDALINGVTVGKGIGNLSGNTVFGVNGLNLNTSGENNNTAVGYQALYSDVNGAFNTAVGFEALYSNTSSANTGIGLRALYRNTSGTENVAIGRRALCCSNSTDALSVTGNGTGSFNVAVGNFSLYMSQSAHDNTAVGYNALFGNTGGSCNVAVGNFSLQNNTANNNTAVGYNSLQAYNNFGDNTAVGYNSLKNNSNAYNTAVGSYSLQANTGGYNNTSVGYYSMYKNTDSYNNTVFGYGALRTQEISGKANGSGGWQNKAGNNTAIGVSALKWTNGSGSDPSGNISGGWNTAVGLNALLYNTTGYYNTAIGLQAGCYFSGSASPDVSTNGGPSTANRCTFLGAESRSSTTNPTQSTAIGYNSVITANNQIMMGTANEVVKIPGGLQLASYWLNFNTTILDFNNNKILPPFITIDGTSSGGVTTTIILPYPTNAKGSIVTIRRRSSNDANCTIKVSDDTAYFGTWNTVGYQTSVSMTSNVMSCTLISDAGGTNVTDTNARWYVIAWVSSNS